MSGVSIFDVSHFYKRVPFGDITNTGWYDYKTKDAQALIIKNETDKEIIVEVSTPSGLVPNRRIRLAEILPGENFSTEVYFGRLLIPMGSKLHIRYLGDAGTTGQIKLSGFNG